MKIKHADDCSIDSTQICDCGALTRAARRNPWAFAYKCGEFVRHKLAIAQLAQRDINLIRVQSAT